MQAAVFAALIGFAALTVPLLANRAMPEAFAQTNVSNGSTIKVTGDASITVTPDQIVFYISRSSQPESDAMNALDEQEKYIADVTKAVEAVSNSTVIVGQKSLSPYYSGQGQYPSDITFSIYATVAVHTSVDELAPLVDKLVAEGYGFESVYFEPSYSFRLLEASGISGSGDSTLPEEGDQKPLIIGVNLNTQPGVLKTTLDEYVSKYKKLVSIVEDLGIDESNIQQTNFYINPQYYGQYQQYSTYSTYTQLQVKTDANSISKVQLAIQQTGGNIDNITTTISDAQIEQARKALTQQAIENAESRAQEIADSLNAAVRSIKSVEIVGQNNYNPYGGQVYYRGVNFVGYPGYYNSGLTDVSVSATVEFEISR